ncbi:FkbM family methyltransferase [Streptomyces sp. TRM68367]|uniref:FkbM family methyltransferase n=1 Tax=Streptomyces sp. TRM68367 TaxID=2758415 RepID=UPI00165AAF01|nr:FkbM family methyltransferase [Streptomyces sp. TRM68367]MBC9726983.1 FkbM family methyltransferase [Streptomyces sp. TRM68367]
MTTTAVPQLSHVKPVLRGARDLLMRSRTFQRAVRAGTVRGHVPLTVWQHLRPTGVWQLHAPDGSTFHYYCGPDDVLAGPVVWTDLRLWEEATHPLFYRLARTARGFLDAGAYAGLYTLLACQANPRLHAISVEPNPVAARMLRRNLDVNGFGNRVQVVGKALSDAPGQARLTVQERITTATLRGDAANPGRHSVDVEVSTADMAVGDRPIDLVKIDVEGLEPEVLRGMAKTLAAHRPIVIAECLDRPALDRLRATAAELGYHHVHHLAPQGPVPVSPGFAPPRRHQNFLLSTGPFPT